MIPPSLSRRRFLGTAAATAGALSAPVAAGEAGSASRGAVESTIERRVTESLDEHDVPGAAVAVVRDGEITMATGYGVADRETERPVEATTPFRIGSVSKAVLWTAVARRIGRGGLDPGTPIAEYLPDGTAWWDGPVTLAHLATHTGGFEATNRGMWYSNPEDVGPLLDHLETARPAQVRAPGEIGAYSNHGAALAGQALASAAGERFPTAVDDALLGPAGMATSSFAQPLPEPMRAAHATGHDAPTVDGKFLGLGIAPAGALSTTAADMARFVQLHVNDGVVDGERVLASGTVDLLHRQWFTHHEPLDGMAFGLIERERGDVRVLHHNGATQSFHSNLVLVPEHGFGLFVAYNSANAATPREAVPEAVLDDLFPASDPDVPAPKGEPNRAAGLTGSYRPLQVPETTHDRLPVAATTGTVDVSVADDGALLLDAGDGSRRFVETAPLVFRNPETGDRLAFGEREGEITHLFRGGSPTALARAEWHEQLFLHAVVAVVAVIGLLSGVTLPVHDAGQSPRAWLAAIRSAPRLRATAVATVGSAAFLAFLTATLLYVMFAPLAFLSAPAAAYRAAFALPAVGAAATLGAVVAGVRAAVSGDERRRRGLHHAIVTASLVTMTGFLWYWNLLLPP